MSVWLTIPSARPDGGTVQLWKDRGYKIALWQDVPDRFSHRVSQEWDGVVMSGEYPGYAVAVNRLIKFVLARDPECDFVVTGGDDTEPDPIHSPGEITQQCGRHFGEAHKQFRMEYVVSSFPLPKQPSARMPWSTFGVMQPTGDRFAHGSIDRIAGSPWIGREFARRVYGGNGPYWHEYRHMFVDEEIMCVAQKLGVFWQRPDLIHFHHHFMRESLACDSWAVQKPTPPHLIEANSRAHWDKYQAIFNHRKALGFPGHEPLSANHGVPGYIRNLKLDNGDPDYLEANL